MITVLAHIHLYFRLPYRQTQGLAESLFGKHTTVPSYSTICKRINKLDLDLTAGRKTHGTIVIAIDSTGMKITNTPSYPRRMAVRIQKRDYSEWRKSSRYGKWWLVESLFSAIKRMFGESVMAHKKENMLHEMALKMAIYNMMVLAA